MEHSNVLGAQSPIDFAFLVGIDWSTAKHDVCVLDPSGKVVKQEQIQQETTTIDSWINEWLAKAGGKPIAIALEQSKGALIYALMHRTDVYLFPINPQQFASYRRSYNNIDAKDDTREALLLARFLLERRRELHMWEPGDEATRLIAHLAQARREAINERTRLSLQLRENLAKSYPVLFSIKSENIGNCPALLAIVRKWPDPRDLKRARLYDIVRTLTENGKGRTKASELAEKLRSEPLHCRDQAVMTTCAIQNRDFAQRIKLSTETIERYDEALQKAVSKHPDRELFEPVRGLGTALLPRVIAAFGSHRERFANAQEVANFAGISPVCRQSGKTRVVLRRRACNRFLLQTFHELANMTVQWTPWARAYYEYHRAHGMKHHATLRKIARCWIRILYRVWKDRKPYDEARYEQTLLIKSPHLRPYMKAA